MTMKSTAKLLGFVALALGPIPSSVIPVVGFDAAYAEKANGNGNSGGGNSGGGNAKSESKAAAKSEKAAAKAEKSNHGALASELKGMNAVHANANALANANPNSQVGRIAAYRDAAVATLDTADALAEAQTALAGMTVPTKTTAQIDAEIAAIVPDSEGSVELLAALQAERQAVLDYDTAVADVTAATTALAGAQGLEDTALLTASGGRVLSDEAIAYVREQLNL